MAKRTNYGFAKRQKELKRQQRNEEKAEKKRLKQGSANGGDQRKVVEGDGRTPEPVDSVPRREEVDDV